MTITQLKKGVMMGKKVIKKKMKPTIDPQLEEVGQDRAFEVFYDEETNDAVILYHYRRHWGDEVDADIDHCLSPEENAQFILALTNILNMQKEVMMKQFTQQSTPVPIESNPMQGSELVEGEKNGDTSSNN